MISDKDYIHMKSLCIRFGNVLRLADKSERQHKQIIKLGSILIFLREWYDLHNNNRQFATLWYKIEDFLLTYDIKPKQIPKYVSLSEDVLSQTKEYKELNYTSRLYNDVSYTCRRQHIKQVKHSESLPV